MRHVDRNSSNARNGEQDFRESGLQHLDGLYSYAMTLVRNQAEAEDLIREVYLRAVQAFSCPRPDTNMKSWLFTILRNVWSNQPRKWRNSPQMTEIQVEDGYSGSVAEPSKD